MRARNNKDVLGGCLMGLLGALFLLGALGMRVGTAQDMGPGYLPATVSVILIGLSLALIWKAGATGGDISIAWRSLMAVSLSVIAFGICLLWLGLVPAIVLSVGIAGFADNESTPRESLILALVLAAAAWAIFRLGLGLPMPAIKEQVLWMLF